MSCCYGIDKDGSPDTNEGSLAEMAKRNMRGILFLSNYWQWSGSFAQ